MSVSAYAERPVVAVSRRLGDEIHPWPPSGDLRPTAAVWRHRLRTSAPELNPVLRSGRREAVLLRIFDAQAAPSDPRALSAIPITLVCRIEHGKRKSASQGKKDVLIPRIRRPIIIAINRHAVISVLPPRVA